MPLARSTEMTQSEASDARLWHPWLGINRVLRAMLHTRRSAEAWSQVRARAMCIRISTLVEGERIT